MSTETVDTIVTPSITAIVCIWKGNKNKLPVILTHSLKKLLVFCLFRNISSLTCSSEISTSMSPASSSAPVIQRSGGWAVRQCCSNFSCLSHSSCLWLLCSSGKTSARSNGSAPSFCNTNSSAQDDLLNSKIWCFSSFCVLDFTSSSKDWLA